MKSIVICILTLFFAAAAVAQTRDRQMPLFWIQENGKYGYIDRAGRVVVKPQFENTMGFNEGLAATRMNGKYGYIDTRGNWVIKPQFDFTYMFSEGLAMVRVGKQYAWIDRRGATVITPRDFEQTGMGFREGRLAVKQGGKWGFIDKTGRMVIEPRFEEVKEFSGGVAQVVTAGHQHHWIDLNGRVLWSQEPKSENGGKKQ